MTAAPIVADDRPRLRSIVGDADHFLSGVFGHSPWRGRSAGVHELFGIDDVDRIVTSAVRVPAIRMIRDGDRVAPEEFCTPVRIGSATLGDVADPRKVLDLFRRGATLVLQSLHRTWSPLSEWCAVLEREIGWPVQANAYLTPVGERGLARHSDGHDVLALQLHGTKRWAVEGLGAVELEVGDVLYVPALVEHSARTETRASLHLTVGIHRPSAERVARRAASLALDRSPPRAATTPAATIAALRSGLQDVDADDIVDGLRRRPRVHEAGLLASAITRPEITQATCLTPTAPWSVAAHDDGVTLTWPDGRLNLPSRTHAALALLAGHDGPVTVGSLPGLDGDEQIVLARRLLDEGATATVPSSGHGNPGTASIRLESPAPRER